MKIENIRQLAELLNQSGLTGIELTEGDMKIRLERYAWHPGPAAAPAVPSMQIPLPPLAAAAAPARGNGQVVDFNKLREVRSPMVGLFHRSPAPEAPPFVEKGGKVRKGEVLCIIEAMKMMNEITADFDGEVVDICAENGQLVEFSQVLFKLY